MNFSISQFLNKLQNLPDKQKKIILWTIVAVLAVIFGFFWIKSAGEKLSKISEGLNQISLPKIESPKIESSQDQADGPAPSEAEGWKTYTNNEYGFEIKYPDQCGFLKTDGENFSFGRIDMTITNSKGVSLVDYVDNFSNNNDWVIETKKILLPPILNLLN